jgi:uncharacterized protein (TIGR03083 family)
MTQTRDGPSANPRPECRSACATMSKTPLFRDWSWRSPRKRFHHGTEERCVRQVGWFNAVMEWDRLGPALDVRPLFAPDRERLLELLGDLPAHEWNRSTGCPGWTVHDLVAHLVHDHLRRLSGTRDGHTPAWVAPDGGLASALHRTNEQFVAAARGISSRLLTDLIAHLGLQLDQLWVGLELDARGGAVSWVQPDEEAPVWLDVAREFSEFWVHQQQIRDAVGRPDSSEPQALVAIVDTLVRSLPRALTSSTAAMLGAAVTLTVDVSDDISIAGRP